MAHIIDITDLSAPELQVYANLTHGDPMRSSSVFLAESEKVIEYALKAGCQPLSFLMERQDTNLPLLSHLPGIPVYTSSRQTIRSLTGYALDRGFLCAMERPSQADKKQIYTGASRVILLRNIPDPADLGAVFRSAAALGMDGILIGEGCCDPLYRRTVRVSMGTVFQVPWAKVLQTELIAEDFACITISQHSQLPPLDLQRWFGCERLLITIDPKARHNAYTLPIAPDTEPLNMASASAVLFWMLRRR